MKQNRGNAISSGKGGSRHPLPQKPGQNLVKRPFYQDPRFAGAVIILLTCIAFFPSLKNEFMTTWDDNAYVTENSIIRDLDLQSVKHMFTKQVNGTYVPLPLLTYSLEYKVFGLHAMPYHVTNLLLHLLCTLLVFQLFRMMKMNLFFAATGAILFGIHPMRVESVAWIAERKDVLYSLFYLAALVTHVKFIEAGEKGTKFYRLTLLFFFLALLSKIEAVTLPLSLLLVDYLMERPLKIKLLLEKIPHFAMSLLFGCFGIFILYRVGLLTVNKQLGFTDRLFYGLFTLNMYIVKFFVPYLQSAVYPYPVKPGNALPVFYYLNPLLTVGLGFLVYKTIRHTRAILFGSLFFLVNVFFLLQFVAAGSAFLSDRYTYIAYTGLIFICIWSLQKLLAGNNKWRPVVVMGLMVYTAAFMVMTFNRCQVWKNGETLWTDVIEKYPGQNVAAYSNRGIFYTNSAQWDNAFADFAKAIAIDPTYPVSFANRGIVYGNLGQPDRAIADFSAAIKIDPGYTLAYHNRGVAYGNQGQNDKAISDLSKAIRLDPKYVSAYNNLSIIYCQKNQTDSAIQVCIEGLRVNPQSFQLHSGLGNCYLARGDVGNASIQFKKCLETSDSDLDALLGMAVVSYLNKDIGYAKGYINRAQVVAPVLNEGMAGIEKLENAGYSLSTGKKQILADLFARMK